MERMHVVPVLLLLAFTASLAGCGQPNYTLTPNPTPYWEDLPDEYYLYLPPDYTPDRDWPVFVGIHGTGGSGLDCLQLWQEYADREGFLLVCPSLADESGGWYQSEGEAALLGILRRVRQECRTQRRVFLAGFSAGGEFVQGFAFDHPGDVAAVAVLSAGNYMPPTRRAREIPFLVVIGERDRAAGIKNAESFVALLEQEGIPVELRLLPKTGHEVTEEAREMTVEFFRQTFEK